MMLQVGVSRWIERWIERNYENRRFPGIWDARLVRETLLLRDGRRLTYFLDGGPQEDDGGGELEQRASLPHIFVFHAMFLSGNVFLTDESPTEYVLVCVNRPGYFGSDAPLTKPHGQSKRTHGTGRLRNGHDSEDEEVDNNDDVDMLGYAYRDFAKDMEELANHLRLNQFYVAGHSSGGPCALACASHLTSRRVAAVGLLSSDPEYAHPHAPNKRWINDWGVGTVLPILLERFLCCLPLARNASAGVRNDYRLETSLYCFSTESIAQPVTIYVGEQDKVLPPDISRHLHERLSNSKLHIIPKMGHVSLLRQDVLHDFFETVISSASGSTAGVGKEGGEDVDTTANFSPLTPTTEESTALHEELVIV